MSEYVSVGDLVEKFKTSKQKIGQIINHLGIERKNIRQGKWYNRCISADDVPKIKAVIKDFRVDQSGAKVKPEKKKVPRKPKVNEFGDNSARLFKNPIVGRYWGNGTDERWGQGLQTVWEKERCEVC